MKTLMKQAAAVLTMATAATAVMATAGAREASAQATTVVVPRHETVQETGPNTALISSGLFTLGIPYVTSVIVATQSDHAGDNHLYIPVAGPWLDLANRGNCGGITQPSCDNETTYKVLLIADGVLQGIGALEIVGGLLTPTTRTVAADRKHQTAALEPHVRVAPTAMGRGGYGLAAVGSF
jgi:hypothetical protein